MAAPVQRRTKPQSDQFLVSTQSGFLGGLNTDLPPSSIDATEVPVLQDLVALRQGMRSVPGWEMVTETWPQDFTGGIIVRVCVYQDAYGVLYGVWEEKDTGVRRLGRCTAPTMGGITWNAATHIIPNTGSADASKVSMHETVGRLWVVIHGSITDGVGGYMVEYANDGEPGTWSTPTPILHPFWNNPVGFGPTGTLSTAKVPKYRLKASRVNFSCQPGDIDVVNHPEQWLVETGCQSDYMEITTPTSNYLLLNMLSSQVTEVGELLAVYRTKNIGYADLGSGLLLTGNDPNQYYLHGFLYKQTPAEGGAVLVYGPTPDQDGDLIDDNILLQVSSAPVGLSPMPMPQEGKAFALSTYMFVGRDYGTIMPIRRIGYHLEGVQTLECLGDPSAIIVNQDMALIVSPGQTERVTLQAVANAGKDTYGEFYPVLATPLMVNPYMGVASPDTIAHFDNASFFARCSDGSVRIWDGTQWSSNLSRGKVDKLLKRAEQGGQGIATHDGVYYLTVPTLGLLRLSIQEKKGNGFTKMSRTYPGLHLNVRDINGSHIVTFKETSGDYTAEIECDNSVLLGYYPLQCKSSTRELEGTQGRAFVQHQKTTLKFVPIPGYSLYTSPVTFYLYVDSSTTYDQRVQSQANGMFAVFNGGRVGTRLRVEWEVTPSSPFMLTAQQTEYQSMDGRPLGESTTEFRADADLASGIIAWIPRGELDNLLGDPIVPAGALQSSSSPWSTAQESFRVPYIPAAYLPVGLSTPPAVWEGTVMGWFYVVQATPLFTLPDGRRVSILANGKLQVDNAPAILLSHMNYFFGMAIVFDAYGFTVHVSDESASVSGSSTPSQTPSVYMRLSGQANTVFWDFRVYNKAVAEESIAAYFHDCAPGRFGFHPPKRQGF